MVMQSNLDVFVLVEGLGVVGEQGRGWQGASEQGQPLPRGTSAAFENFDHWVHPNEFWVFSGLSFAHLTIYEILHPWACYVALHPG